MIDESGNLVTYEEVVCNKWRQQFNKDYTFTGNTKFKMDTLNVALSYKKL